MMLRRLPAAASSACRRWPTTAGRCRTTTTTRRTKTGTFALHTLKDTETIARLATGIKRFNAARRVQLHQDLPAHRRPRQAAATASRPATRSASEYEDRRQYVKAADGVEEGHRGVRHRRQRPPPAAARPDRRQLGPLRAGQHAARRHKADRRLPLPQRQARSRFEAHADQGRQAARRREGLPQGQPRRSSTGSRSTSTTSAIASSSRTRTQYLGEQGRRPGTWT